MRPTVVIGYPGFGDIEIEKEILSTIDAEVIHTGSMDSTEAQAAVRMADAVMVTIQPVRAELIAAMQRCRLIARVGTGLDAIDLEAATQHGVWVTYVPDYSIDEVSTHAVTLLLAQGRGLARLLKATQAGKWDGSGVYVRRIKGQVLGLIGCGRIGLAMAAKGKGLGLEVIVYDPFLAPNALASEGIRQVDLPELLRASDFVSIHTPLTRDNRHIINATTLAQMKPTAFLINTARGPLVDEAALLAAVQSGTIAGAALDVLSVEPPAPDNPLLHDDRILITPHMAWYSEEAKVDVRRRGAEEVVRVLSNEPPRAPVNAIERTTIIQTKARGMEDHDAHHV
jgi:D-3-phosphoglycerate dehydrogenase / 2-oxoglutarate reductase